VFNAAKLVATGTTLSSNSGGTASGLGSDGGGIYNTGTATISGSTFNGNVAGAGGTGRRMAVQSLTAARLR
jgi:hypothetical protein